MLPLICLCGFCAADHPGHPGHVVGETDKRICPKCGRMARLLEMLVEPVPAKQDFSLAK